MVAVVALATAPSAAAERIARAILERRLAGCVNVVPTFRSRYWCKGELRSDEEAALLLKTVGERIVALEMTAGSAPYLDWIGRDASGEAGPPASGTQ